MGIDGGNGKDWETNAKSIQLIKQRGKVKALDEEIHSTLIYIFFPTLTTLTSHIIPKTRYCASFTTSSVMWCGVVWCAFASYRAAGYRPGCGV